MKDRNEWMNKRKVKRCFVAHPDWTIRWAIKSDKMRQSPWNTDWIREQHWSWKDWRWKFYQDFQQIVSLFYFIEQKQGLKLKSFEFERWVTMIILTFSTDSSDRYDHKVHTKSVRIVYSYKWCIVVLVPPQKYISTVIAIGIIFIEVRWVTVAFQPHVLT